MRECQDVLQSILMMDLSRKESDQRPLSILREISYLLKLMLMLMGLYSKITAASVESCNDRLGSETIAREVKEKQKCITAGAVVG